MTFFFFRCFVFEKILLLRSRIRSFFNLFILHFVASLLVKAFQRETMLLRSLPPSSTSVSLAGSNHGRAVDWSAIQHRKRSSNRTLVPRSTRALDGADADAPSSPPPPPATFTVDLKVRDSELDQFLVVNNANYSVYLQHARHEFLEKIGLPVAAATEEGGALALSRLVLNFKAPLRSGDVARVGVRVVSTKGARVEMEQWVDAVRRKERRARGGEEEGRGEAAAATKEGAAQEETETITRALDAEATVVALDGRYRPQRLPWAVQKALETGERVPEGTRWFSEKRSGSGSGSESSFDSD